MTNSQFCVRQRQQERQRLNKLLIFGFAGSFVVHGVLAYALPRWQGEPTKTANEPMELILVDKPKPEPKVESKPIVEPKPKPVKPPEPVKAETPPPPVEPPKPVQAQTPPPKPKPAPEPVAKPTPAPKKVLATPTTAPSQPIVSAPVENTAQPSSLSSNFTAPSSSSVTSTETSSDSPGAPSSAVATNSAPPRPESNESQSLEGISCVSNCEPEYPATLEGVEGSAGIKLTIDKDGNVISAELASADGNSQINRQALLAARQMQFSSPGDDAASVQVKIEFTVEGSQYDRARREEQERKEQAAREKEEIEAARQQQLEAERQAQQEQLERERQARQEQLQQQQEPTPPPAPQAKPVPKPLPALSPEELDEERLRKFRERMENYQ